MFDGHIVGEIAPAGDRGQFGLMMAGIAEEAAD